jgi:hypothetical protein
MTLTMVSIAQVIDMRKTIKPHVNEVRYVSLARPLAGLSYLARGMR